MTMNMFKITILAVGKIKNKAIAELINNYTKRLSHLAKLDIVELPAVSFSDSSQAKAKQSEGQAILAWLAKQTGAEVWLLDERGKNLTSTDLAASLTKSSAKVIMVVGGALGLAEEVKQKIKFHLALSKMTLPHELARLILLEQIYRAATISQGIDYHY